MHKFGEFSREIETKPGERVDLATSSNAGRGESKESTLDEIGISKQTANRCEKLAEHSMDEIEAVFNEVKAKAKEKPITYADVEWGRLTGRADDCESMLPFEYRTAYYAQIPLYKIYTETFLMLLYAMWA